MNIDVINIYASVKNYHAINVNLIRVTRYDYKPYNSKNGVISGLFLLVSFSLTTYSKFRNIST